MVQVVSDRLSPGYVSLYGFTNRHNRFGEEKSGLHPSRFVPPDIDTGINNHSHPHPYFSDDPTSCFPCLPPVQNFLLNSGSHEMKAGSQEGMNRRKARKRREAPAIPVACPPWFFPLHPSGHQKHAKVAPPFGSKAVALLPGEGQPGGHRAPFQAVSSICCRSLYYEFPESAGTQHGLANSA